jgi:hypothetical protein
VRWPSLDPTGAAQNDFRACSLSGDLRRFPSLCDPVDSTRRRNLAMDSRNRGFGYHVLMLGASMWAARSVKAQALPATYIATHMWA